MTIPLSVMAHLVTGLYKTAFAPGQHVARQHVACCPSTKLMLPIRATCYRATCCRQHTVYIDGNMLLVLATFCQATMLPWYKRGLRSKGQKLFNHETTLRLL